MGDDEHISKEHSLFITNREQAKKPEQEKAATTAAAAAAVYDEEEHNVQHVLRAASIVSIHCSAVNTV